MHRTHLVPEQERSAERAERDTSDGERDLLRPRSEVPPARDEDVAASVDESTDGDDRVARPGPETAATDDDVAASVQDVEDSVATAGALDGDLALPDGDSATRVSEAEMLDDGRETPDERSDAADADANTAGESSDLDLVDERFTRHRAGDTVVLYDRLEQTTWVQADLDPADLV